VDAIRRHFKKEVNLKDIVEDFDLRGYDEYRDSDALTRFQRAVLERTH
jgi:hypothetical protein